LVVHRVDDGFAVAARINRSVTDRALHLFHLGLDGSLSAGGSIADSDSGDGGEGFVVELGWSGSDLRLLYTWAAQNSITLLQRATRDGALIGNPLGVGPPNAGPYQFISVGNDTIALRNSRRVPGALLNLSRWTATGTLAWPEVTVARARSIEAAQLEQQGGDAIVAWIDFRLSLVRVRIAP